MSSDNTKPPKPNAAFDKPYGEIWQQHLDRMVDAHYSESQARSSPVKWRSLGKLAKAGRL